VGAVKVTVNKTYLSLSNKNQFAILKSTKDGLVIGVPTRAVKAVKNKEFAATKNLGSDKITHKVLLVEEGDFTEGMMKVLKAAYQSY
jgi:hypothetical protein